MGVQSRVDGSFSCEGKEVGEGGAAHSRLGNPVVLASVALGHVLCYKAIEEGDGIVGRKLDSSWGVAELLGMALEVLVLAIPALQADCSFGEKAAHREE